MIIDAVLLIGFLLVILFVFAETKHKKILGIFGALILVSLGVGIAVDGVQLLEGASTYTYGNQTSYFNVTTNQTIVTMDYTDVVMYSYTDVSIPYVNSKDFLALLIIGIGMFAAMHYGLNILA